jgi:RHS repeat-associated protein
VTDALGNVTAFDYFDNAALNPGDRGNVLWVRDARYSVTGKQFEYAYNAYGQKVLEKNLNDVYTEFEYTDTWGNLTKVIQDVGMGKLNRTTEMTYDGAGRVTQSKDPKAQTSTFVYNGVGQPEEANLPGETITYSYGDNGRTESVEDNRGTTTIAYQSGNDRVASVTDPVTGAVSYTYDLFGNRTSVTLPGSGTWDYDYNYSAWGGGGDEPDSFAPQLARVWDDEGRNVEYDFSVQGALLAARTNRGYSGGSLVQQQVTTYTYDQGSLASQSRMWLAEIQNTWHWQSGGWNSQVQVQNNYTYSLNGNRLTNTISDNSGPIRTEEYGYDGLSRLTGVDYDDGDVQSYTFDPMGNRLTKVHNGSSESYTYNNANMLLTRGAGSYTNDLNGNTLTGGGRTNTWDGQDRLTQVVNGSTTTSHVYGADDLRRRTTQGSTVTDFVLDGSSVVRELRGSTVHATYLHGARGPEYRRDSSGNVKWYLYDGLGSVLGEVNPSGTITATRKYDVYGAVRGSTGTGTSNHKFVGNLGHPSEDETGLIYMQARYMDPATGRFLSEDKARDGGNWYAYAHNCPVNKTDRNGFWAEHVYHRAWQFGLYNTFANLVAYFFEALITAPGGFDGGVHHSSIMHFIRSGAARFMAGMTTSLAGGGWVQIGFSEMVRGGLSVLVGVTALAAFVSAKGMAIYWMLDAFRLSDEIA